jgi:hypothetical protein
MYVRVDLKGHVCTRLRLTKKWTLPKPGIAPLWYTQGRHISRYPEGPKASRPCLSIWLTQLPEPKLPFPSPRGLCLRRFKTPPSYTKSEGYPCALDWYLTKFLHGYDARGRYVFVRIGPR